MKTFKLLFAVLIIAVAGVSCDSEPVDPVVTDQDPNENPGGGNNNGGNNAGDGTYWPLAMGNKWIYNISNGTTTEVTILGTETLDGQTWYKFGQENTGATGNSFLRISDGDYFLRSSALTAQGASVTGINYVVLKDDIAVNDTWEDSFTQSISYGIPGFPDVEYPVEIDGKILEKGISYMVEGNAYTDVIHSRVWQTMTGDGFVIITTTDTWYAKNVGAIKTVTSTSEETITQTLVSYELN
ncbi:hypothetical protein OGH69_07330 [Flavobacterium sp. MFBS3-15]|uniref:hypothetical protein n=1 Tax=Flavobacterium sp. MFBS3-15 TaxID=2989816 RepID=UPI0022361075|nr:hypothetical protein [Flavobacterium sp. MFBS3-15]MCW4468767.1 hypothetical protein [Flavobacterium sp. MFBS3-15]